MKRTWLAAEICLAASALAGALGAPANEPSEPEGYHWELPKGFPRPQVPPGNPMSAAKVKLGRYLFYDKRLSGNGTQSCASCHRQELAFTDGKPRAEGATGEVHPRGAMSLVNVAYNSVLTWSNPGLHALEEQALTPMFGRHPVELGLSGDAGELLRIFRTDAVYRRACPASFSGQRDPFTIPKRDGSHRCV
jgi:cytochrome c peroxidase